MKILATVAFFTIGACFPQDPNLGFISKGPGSNVVIQGPDGSVIKADAVGGVVSVNGLIPPADPAVLTEAVAPTAAPTVPNPDASSTTSSVSTEGTTGKTGETDEIPEVTTVSKEVPGTKEVEILEPQPPVPGTPIQPDVELNGPSGKISVNSLGVIVAGPASLLVKENIHRIPLSSAAREIQLVPEPSGIKRLSDETVNVEREKLRVAFIAPPYRGPEWTNLIVPGIPLIYNPYRI